MVTLAGARAVVGIAHGRSQIVTTARVLADRGPGQGLPQDDRVGRVPPLCWQTGLGDDVEQVGREEMKTQGTVLPLGIDDLPHLETSTRPGTCT